MSLPQILTENLFTKLPLPLTPSTCTGKTYIITGGNHGLGLETARHLVLSSATRVILTVRRMSAGEQAKSSIERSTGRKGVIELWELDLASFESIRKFADRVAREVQRIDAFVANAGVYMDRWEEVGGVERSVAVNVVGTMLLSVLVMPKLVESARAFGNEPRMVFTGSALGFVAEKELAKCGEKDVFVGLNEEKEADLDQRYALSKLVQMYAVRELAAVCPVERTGVTINTIAPGLVSTGLGNDASKKNQAFFSVLRALFARTAEQGSRTILYGVVAGRDSHGKMLSGCKIKEHWVPKWMSDKEGKKMQKQIWSELVEKMEAQQPDCTSRLSELSI